MKRYEPTTTHEEDRETFKKSVSFWLDLSNEQFNSGDLMGAKHCHERAVFFLRRANVADMCLEALAAVQRDNPPRGYRFQA